MLGSHCVSLPPTEDINRLVLKRETFMSKNVNYYWLFLKSNTVVVTHYNICKIITEMLPEVYFFTASLQKDPSQTFAFCKEGLK